MDVKTALLQRKSTRAFLDKEVSIDIINKIIEQSKTAPSGVNTQPWQIAVITGDSKTNLCNKFEKAFRFCRCLFQTALHFYFFHLNHNHLYLVV